MRILVTGSAGFLGRAVMPLLRQGVGHRYSSVTAWSQAVDGDFLSSVVRRQVLEQTRPDVVLHMAWLSTRAQDYELDSANTEWANATVRFAREAIGINARFIGIGSMIEDDPGVATAYAKAKRLAASGVLDESSSRGLAAWLRPSWIFDFIDPRPRVLSLHAQARSQGLQFRPDNPDARKDFIHVKDVARAIQLNVDLGLIGQWDVTSGYLTSVGQLLSCYDLWCESRLEPQASEDAVSGSPLVELLGRQDVGDLGFQASESEHLLGRCWRLP